MAKKPVPVTLRKPPSVDADRFVSEGANDTRHAPIAVAERRPADEMITRPDGRVLRELTVYLPTELARKLSLACMERDRDVSNVLAEILDAHLAGVPAAQKPADPVAQAIETAQQMLRALWSKRPRFV